MKGQRIRQQSLSPTWGGASLGASLLVPGDVSFSVSRVRPESAVHHNRHRPRSENDQQRVHKRYAVTRTHIEGKVHYGDEQNIQKEHPSKGRFLIAQGEPADNCEGKNYPVRENSHRSQGSLNARERPRPENLIRTEPEVADFLQPDRNEAPPTLAPKVICNPPTSPIDFMLVGQ